MKRTVSFLTIVLLCGLTHLFAHDFEVDGIYYKKSGSNAYVTYRGSSYAFYSNEYSGNIVIPSTVTHNGTTYNVVGIGQYAFYDCSGLTSVIIPESVTSIDNYAFFGCIGLTSVIIPEPVKSIGDFAFDACIGLTSVIIPESVTSIGNYAFWDCSNLKQVISMAVTPPTMGTNSFQNIEVLVPINGYYSYKKDFIWKAYNILPLDPSDDEDEMVSIQVRIAGSLASEVLRAGYQSADIRRLTITGDSINRDDWIVIRDQMPNLYDLNLENLRITVIPNYLSNKLLSCLVLPNTTKTISDNAFKSCGLYNFDLIIPQSTRTIGKSAFAYNLLCSTAIYGAQSIGESAFQNCEFLKTASLPDGLLKIGTSAFQDCTALESALLPEGLITIGASAFQHARKLSELTLPSSLQSIGDYAFQSTAITSVNLPEELSAMGEAAFSSCTKLAGSITIPNKITSIPTTAFSGCSSLKKVVFNDRLISIGWQAFSSCTSVDTLDIPPSVQTISQQAFSNCSGLKQLTVHWETPLSLQEQQQFEGIDKSACKLVIPQMSATKYLTAPVWKEFITIAENDEVEPHYLNELESLMSEAEMWTKEFPNVEGRQAVTDAVNEGKNVQNIPGWYVVDVMVAQNHITEALNTFKANCVAPLKELVDSVTAFKAGDTSGVPYADLDEALAEAQRVLKAMECGAITDAFESLTYAFATMIYFPENTAEYTGLAPEILYVSPLSPVVKAERLEANVGTWQTVLNVEFNASGTRYTKQVDYTYTITPATLTVTANDATRSYGEKNPAFSVTYSGFKNGEDESVLTTKPDVTTTADMLSGVGSYSINVGGAEAANYTFRYVSGTLTITKAYQLILWDQDLSDLEAGQQIELTATSTMGLPITYKLDANNYVALYKANGKTYLDCLSGGNIQIRAQQEGDRNVLAAETVTKNIHVKKSDSSNPYLTIRQSDGGTMKLLVEKKQSQILYITTDEGWHLHSVTFNGEDMTSSVTDKGVFLTPSIENNSLVIIAYESDDNGVQSHRISDVRITGSQGMVHVEGTAPGDAITVYDMEGRVVKDVQASGRATDIRLEEDATYIIRVAEKVVKIFL